MLPAIAYLSSPDILRVSQPTLRTEPVLKHSGRSGRSPWLRSAVATIVVLLSTLAVAAPSWAGPAGGC